MIDKKKLHNRNKSEAIKFLAESDPVIKQIIEKYGIPKIWKREEGFETLINIIIEQMLSTKAAASIFAKFKTVLKKVTPENILKTDDQKLREAGLSYSKIKYCKNISQAVIDGELDLFALRKMDNDEAVKELTKIKGVGDWTAYIYIIACLQRADIWPYGDNALAVAVQKHKNLKKFPSKKELISIGEKYKPWCTMAAFLYWNTFN